MEPTERFAPARARRARTGRGSRAVAVLVAATLIALAAACGPPEPPKDAYGLRTVLGDGEIVLEWSAPPGAAGATYEVQYGVGAGWLPLTTTTDTTATFSDVQERSTYWFRVRTAAQAGKSAGSWSPAVTAYYVEPVLPIVRIDTNGAAPILDRDNYVPGTISIDPNGSGYAAYSGTMGIRGRGNSTWAYPKKPYRVKLDTKSPIMGIAAERDWVLLANYNDRSQLRTVAAMEASRATDMAYTPTLRHVEVILNGRYDGVYVLTQHNEVGPDRVDITEMEPEDIAGEELTGGYRLEIDARLEENNEPGFRTGKNVPVVIKDPDPAAPQQRTYIRQFVQAFEDALFSPGFRDPNTGWRKYADERTFIDHYLVHELTRNQDYFFSSTFFTKERGDDKIRFGPVWDFDNSMGTIRGAGEFPPEGWFARTRPRPWINRIFQDETLRQEIVERWNELKPAFEAIPPLLADLGEELEEAVLNDAARWGYEPHETDEPGFLVDWLNTRIAWIDQELATAP